MPLLGALLGALLLGLPTSGAAESTPPVRALPFSPAGRILLSRDEALALAFGKASVERSTVYLTEKDKQAIARLAKLEFKSSVVYSYRASRAGKWIGTAYFDTHRVRTLRETVMVVVKPDNTIGRVEVLSFAEPKNYLPRAPWYEQFRGRKLDRELNLKRKIRGVTGASLTAQATTKCARRMLALHQRLANLAEAKRRDAERKQREKRKHKGGDPPVRPAPHGS